MVEVVELLLGTEKAFGRHSKEAGEKIVKFYESQTGYSRNLYLPLYSQLFSDLFFNIPQIREARKKTAAGYPVYFYLYNFVSDARKHEFLDGAAHASELHNFFGGFFGQPGLPLEGVVGRVQKTMMDLFISFVKTG